MLARLDKIVFKDIVGIELNTEKIETEKEFQPKLGNVNFKYDSTCRKNR